MKSKFLTIFLYLILVLVAGTIGFLWMLFCLVNDVVRYYNGGILLIVYGLIGLLGIILPILIFAKCHRKWILPAVLSFSLVFTFIGCLKINDHIKDSLRFFSTEKWEKYEYLRLHMLDDLEKQFTFEGATEEKVLELLGQPRYVNEMDGKKTLHYTVAVAMVDEIVFYVSLEDGVVVETGRYQT